MSDLEKVDLIRTRLPVSYKEAKDALDKADGDVVQALIYLEQKETDVDSDFRKHVDGAFNQVKGLFDANQGYRIKLKHGEQTVTKIPASVGALGLLGVFASSHIALAGVLASVAGMANNYTIEIERAEGQESQAETLAKKTPETPEEKASESDI